MFDIQSVAAQMITFFPDDSTPFEAIWKWLIVVEFSLGPFRMVLHNCTSSVNLHLSTCGKMTQNRNCVHCVTSSRLDLVVILLVLSYLALVSDLTLFLYQPMRRTTGTIQNQFVTLPWHAAIFPSLDDSLTCSLISYIKLHSMAAYLGSLRLNHKSVEGEVNFSSFSPS